MSATSHTEKAVDSQSRPLSRVRPRPSEKVTDAEYIARFKARSTFNEKGCWVHGGRQRVSKGMAPGAAGYIQISYRCKIVALHRLSYALHFGPVPEGKVVAHSCDNPPCWNPEHLSAKTEMENAAEMIEKRRNFEQRRTHCPYGHEYNEENTEFKRAKSGRLARECRICLKAREQTPKYIEARRARQRRYRMEKRVARQESLR